jgi:ANTAR domain
MAERDTPEERRAWLWSQIRDAATAEDAPVGMRHMCTTVTSALEASDVVVYKVVDGGRSEPVYVTGTVGDRVSEAQVTYGEGPAVDCLREECPVLVPDIAVGAKWPVFAPFASSRGVAAMFSFPVMMGAIVVGCLEAHRRATGGLTDFQVVDGLLLADAAALLLLRAEPSEVGADPFSDEVEARWATVHQATGMVSVQLGSDLATAFIRLRAHAYQTGTRLADVASAVLARRLRFDPDPQLWPNGGLGRE